MFTDFRHNNFYVPIHCIPSLNLDGVSERMFFRFLLELVGS